MANAQRKRRTIKNGLVNLDDVECPPGIQYVNWIPIVRQKLFERENILLHKRYQVCQHVIQQSLNYLISICNQNVRENNQKIIDIQAIQRINQHHYNKYFVNNSEIDQIKQECMEHIKRDLSAWNGIEKLPAEPLSFKEYFKTCKNNLDQRKLKILARYYWLPLLYHFKKFTDHAASHIVLNQPQLSSLRQQYTSYLNHLILQAVVEAKLKLHNARAMVVIAKRIYLEFHKSTNPFLKQSFSLGNHGSEHSAQPEGDQDSQRTNSGHAMREIMVESITEKCRAYQRQFVMALNEIYRYRYQEEQRRERQRMNQMNLAQRNMVNAAMNSTVNATANMTVNTTATNSARVRLVAPPVLLIVVNTHNMTWNAYSITMSSNNNNNNNNNSFNHQNNYSYGGVRGTTQNMQCQNRRYRPY